MPTCSQLSPDAGAVCLLKRGHRRHHKYTPITGINQACNVWVMADGRGGSHFVRLSSGTRRRLHAECRRFAPETAAVEREILQ